VRSAREPEATQVDDGLFDAFVQRESPALLRLAWGLSGSRGEHATDHLPDEVVADAAELVAVRRSVVAALHTLPARQRAVVVLRYLDDRTETQTAAALGCSVGTVKSQTSRAMAALRASPHLAEVWGSRAEAAP
jgi:RNA polymerase sigma factor (sigma-70 family)